MFLLSKVYVEKEDYAINGKNHGTLRVFYVKSNESSRLKTRDYESFELLMQNNSQILSIKYFKENGKICLDSKEKLTPELAKIIKDNVPKLSVFLDEILQNGKF